MGSKPLVPKLRFPEFRDAPEWTKVNLGGIATFQKGQGLPKSSISPTGDVPCIHYGELFLKYGEVIDTIRSRTSWKDNLVRSKPGDVLMPTSDVTPRGLAKASCITEADVVLGGDILVIRLMDAEASGQFLARFIRHLEPQVLQLVSGSTVFHLYASSLEKLRLSHPGNFEQKKIAKCLRSLDELIEAEGRKLEALRDHKKGLMQNLFPREGETNPRLRFPEFRDAGEWHRYQLGHLCRFVRGPFGGALKKETFVSDGYAVYEQSHAIDGDIYHFRYFITKDRYDQMTRFAVQPNDLIMSCSGTMGKFAQVPEKPVAGVINQALLKLSVLHGWDSHFLLLALGLPVTQSKLLTQSAGGAMKNVLGVPQLKQIEVPMPREDEQHRIVSCLTSLDALITAQSKKLDTLKLHKQGLMQGLFPPTEGS